MDDSSPSDLPDTNRPSIEASSTRTFSRTLWVAGLAALVAFRSVLGAPYDWREFGELDAWFFDPARDSRSIAIVVAAWLLWNRRKAIAACGIPRTAPVDRVAAVAVLLLFCWAAWWRAPLLSMFSVYVFGAALAAAWGGAVGVRYLTLPCLALLFSMPPPNPIFSEVVWWLQGVTAQGAHSILSLGGFDIEIAGTELHLGERVFAVIEACSGWRGISILLIVSVVASELNALKMAQTMILAAIAVLLGLGLNTARVATIIVTQSELNAEQFESHTPQGVVVLLVGGGILYMVGLGLGGATGRSTNTMDPKQTKRRGGDSTIGSAVQRRFSRFALSLSIALAIASLLLPFLSTRLWATDSGAIVRDGFDFPLSAADWVGTVLEPNYFFPYASGQHLQFHAEYLRNAPRTGPQRVDLFIALESPQVIGLNRLPESKLLLPAPDWEIESRKSERIAALGVDVRSATVSRGDPKQLAHVITWRVNDRGLMIESIASLLGMDACDFGRGPCGRAVVRLAVRVHNDNDAGWERAQRTAKRFMRVFQRSLMQLPRS